MGTLQGKVAVVTGSTTGIGLAAAHLFVKEGAHVFITGRRQKELNQAVRAIGINATGVQGELEARDLMTFGAAMLAAGVGVTVWSLPHAEQSRGRFHQSSTPSSCYRKSHIQLRCHGSRSCVSN
jgi:NAD(P)-dependent dehydrogenase (short-subunit alcohol dehydrogenase family)